MNAPLYLCRFILPDICYTKKFFMCGYTLIFSQPFFLKIHHQIQVFIFNYLKRWWIFWQPFFWKFTTKFKFKLKKSKKGSEFLKLGGEFFIVFNVNFLLTNLTTTKTTTTTISLPKEFHFSVLFLIKFDQNYQQMILLINLLIKRDDFYDYFDYYFVELINYLKEFIQLNDYYGELSREILLILITKNTSTNSTININNSITPINNINNNLIPFINSLTTRLSFTFNKNFTKTTTLILYQKQQPKTIQYRFTVLLKNTKLYF